MAEPSLVYEGVSDEETGRIVSWKAWLEFPGRPPRVVGVGSAATLKEASEQAEADWAELAENSF